MDNKKKKKCTFSLTRPPVRDPGLPVPALRLATDVGNVFYVCIRRHEIENDYKQTRVITFVFYINYYLKKMINVYKISFTLISALAQLDRNHFARHFASRYRYPTRNIQPFNVHRRTKRKNGEKNTENRLPSSKYDDANFFYFQRTPYTISRFDG